MTSNQEQPMLPNRMPLNEPPIELAHTTFRRDALTMSKVIAGLASLNSPKPA
ncbi:hypothetical protein ACIGO9_28695 [Nocardia asteroides]|uniref:hypothetical protein n=1 Tax=Nocardia asteroides TaxID=1824 RepID=UPI0037CA082E